MPPEITFCLDYYQADEFKIPLASGLTAQNRVSWYQFGDKSLVIRCSPTQIRHLLSVKGDFFFSFVSIFLYAEDVTVISNQKGKL